MNPNGKRVQLHTAAVSHMGITRRDHSCFCLLPPLTYRCCSCRTSRFPFVESSSFVCWRTECEIPIVMSPASWFCNFSKNSWNARNVRWNVSHSHSLGCFLIWLSRQQCTHRLSLRKVLKRLSRLFLQPLLSSSDSIFDKSCVQFRPLVYSMGFSRPTWRLHRRNLLIWLRCYRSSTRNCVFWRWLGKKGNRHTNRFLDIFCELNCIFLQVTAQRVHKT